MEGQISKDIARFVVENGKEGAFNTKNTYIIELTLEDRRCLTLVYSGKDSKSTEDPSEEATLEIIVKPETDDQIGFKTAERGLTGKYTIFQVLIGKEGYLPPLVKPCLHHSTCADIQKEYDRLINLVHQALYP